MRRAQLPAPPERMELFQAIRLIEQAARAEGRPARLGEAEHPADEPLHLAARPGTAFAAGEVAALKPDEHGGPDTLVMGGFGLFGPMGTLPQAYTDLISTRLRAHDTALAAFLDLFNHRIGALFYRAWAKYRLPIAHERAGGDDDPVSSLLYALIGHGLPGLRARGAVPDAVLLHYGGLFARRVRHADGLAALLSDHFARPVRVEQFAGRWLRLGEAELTRLGAAHAALGQDTIAGPKLWDVQGAFRLSVGPLDYPTFTAFMPGGRALAALGALTRLYVGPGLEFEVEVVLARTAVPGIQLGASAGAAPQLGWNTWLTSAAPDHDPRDAVFRIRQEQEEARTA